MKKIIEVYKKDLSKNLDEIAQLLGEKKINDPGIKSCCDEILLLSCENIVKKWLVGRKHLRTLFVREAFASFYPEKVVKTSVYIDAIINILDDLLDEEISDEEKKLYILEFLRVFSLYNYEHPPEEIQTYLGSYFNKLISLAITEDYYKNLVGSENEMKKLIEYSIKVLDCRSMDIDIFNEMAISCNCCNYSSSEKEKIKKAGRIFRAVNIMKKDIKDLNHDKETNQESIISKITEKKLNFCEYVSLVSNYYLSKANKIRMTRSTNDGCNIPVNNFYNMIKRDKGKITELAKERCHL